MTWTPPKNPPYPPVSELFASEWNKYVGASGNVAYLVDQYSNANTVNYNNLSNTTVANNTLTALNVVNSPLTSFFTVPSSLYESSGLYYVYVNVVGNPEAAGSSNRRIDILRGGTTGGWSTILTHGTFSSDTAGIKNVSTCFFPILSSGDKLLINFLHTVGTSQVFTCHVICRRLSK